MTKTNDKSCLVDATVHILSVHLFRNPNIDPKYYETDTRINRQQLIDSIGHDGSERGFHTQEIQDALRHQNLNIAMVRHELYPCLQLPPGPEDTTRVRVVPIYDKLDAANIFLPKINKHDGVLMVRAGNGVHHALSFQSGSNTAYDVVKDEYLPLENLDIVMFLEFIDLDEVN